MLLQLTEYLGQFHSGFGVFQYLTLRAILGALTALTISLIVGPSMIRRLSKFQMVKRCARTDRSRISPRLARRPWADH